MLSAPSHPRRAPRPTAALPPMPLRPGAPPAVLPAQALVVYALPAGSSTSASTVLQPGWWELHVLRPHHSPPPACLRTTPAAPQGNGKLPGTLSSSPGAAWNLAMTIAAAELPRWRRPRLPVADVSPAPCVRGSPLPTAPRWPMPLLFPPSEGAPPVLQHVRRGMPGAAREGSTLRQQVALRRISLQAAFTSRCTREACLRWSVCAWQLCRRMLQAVVRCNEDSHCRSSSMRSHHSPGPSAHAVDAQFFSGRNRTPTTRPSWSHVKHHAGGASGVLHAPHASMHHSRHIQPLSTC